MRSGGIRKGVAGILQVGGLAWSSVHDIQCVLADARMLKATGIDRSILSSILR